MEWRPTHNKGTQRYGPYSKPGEMVNKLSPGIPLTRDKLQSRWKSAMGNMQIQEKEEQRAAAMVMGCRMEIGKMRKRKRYPSYQ